jgi:diguanylate cyclase (GGDEF)-like protein/PAS domain S-box-containing protein
MAGRVPAAQASQTMTDRAFGLPAHPWASLARRGWTRSLLLSRSVPFVGTTVLALAAVAIVGTVTSPILVAAGLLVAFGVTLASVVAPWDRLPAWADVAAAGTMMVGLGAIREGSGGTASGYAPLLLIPLLWLAYVGSKPRAAIGLLAMLIILGGPMLVAGHALEVDYWRRLGLLIVASGFSVATVSRLVDEAKNASSEVERHVTRLAEQVAVTKAVLDAAGDMIVSFDQDGRIVAVNNAVLTDLGWTEEQLLGQAMFETLAPAAPGPQTGEHGTVFGLAESGGAAVGSDGHFETEFRRADGRMVPVEISVAITGGPGAIVTNAFARDISFRRRADETTREHLHDLARLLTVARDLGRPTAATDGRDAVCEAARELAGADLALFFEAQPKSGLLVATGVAGESHVPNQVTLDSQRSLAAKVFAASIPEFVGDMDVDERVDREVARQMRVRAALLQPVTRDGRPIGVLVVYWREPMASLSERIRSLLELFATQVAGVVERADLTSRLENLARTDSLTGLANRRALEESLVGELARAERSGQPLSVVMLDIDHFKSYNDEHGHQAGDGLLRDLAKAWAGELRPSDLLARFGGEEFLAVLPATDRTAARKVADRMRLATPTATTSSAGVATWETHETMVDLVARADAALYQAKRLGRDRTEVARSSEVERLRVAPAIAAPGRLAG